MGVLDPPAAPLVQFRRTQGRQLVPVADRAAPPWSVSQQLSDGTITGGTARYRHTAIQTARGVVLAFSNWYNNAGAETDGPQDITVSFAVEPATTKVVPGYFNGQRSVVIKPGATVFSDPLGVNLVKGQTFYTRTFISIVTAATKFPSGGFLLNGNNGDGHNYSSGPGADLTAAGSGSVPTVSNVRAYGPAAILGLPARPGASVVGAVGDSIIAGSGDTGLWVDGGWLIRALNFGYAYQSIAQPSQTIDQWYAQEGINKSRQQAFLERTGPTHLLCELVVNGLGAGISSVQTHLLGTGLKGAWSALAAFGLPVFATTCTPQTTSTDGWSSTANQTIASAGNETTRLAYNAWLRDGAPITDAPASGGVPAAVGTVGAIRCPVYDATCTRISAGSADLRHPLALGGVIEIADTLESARDSGIWRFPGRKVTDAAITSGQVNLTSATAAFVAGDVGKSVTVVGAGAAGAVLNASILSITNSTTVVLSTGAGTTVSGAVAGIGAPTGDGTHPAASGAILASAAFVPATLGLVAAA